MRSPIIGALGAALLLSAGAGWWALGARDATTEDSRPARPTVVQVTAKDFSFELPGSVKAGPVNVRFTNVGLEPHHGFIYALREGVTYEEFERAVMKNDDNVPEVSPGWVIGMAQAIGTGDSLTYKGELEAGSYAVVCFIKDFHSGKNHVEMGMVDRLEVH